MIQGGNNNAYCQDNETTWFDWASADTGLPDLTRQLIALRKAHPVFRRRRSARAGAEVHPVMGGNGPLTLRGGRGRAAERRPGCVRGFPACGRSTSSAT